MLRRNVFDLIYQNENYSKLGDIKKYLEKIKGHFKLYNYHKEKLAESEKIIDEFESDSDNQCLIEKLNEFKEECKNRKILHGDNVAMQRFLLTNNDLEEYYKATMNRDSYQKMIKKDLNFMNNFHSKYVILIKNNKKYLLDISEQELLDINEFDQEFTNFILNGLNDKHIFEVNEDELPLLMAINEDIDNNDETRKNIIYSEFMSAKKLDLGVDEKLFFIHDSNTQIKIWEELDERKLTGDKYWIEYYKILIQFGNNIEDLYKEAPIDKKQYVIDAYYYFSTQENPDKHFRTSSPLINVEVLKRKYMKK